MDIHQKFFKSLLWATVSVAVVLTLMLVSALTIKYAIAPLLIDASLQLQQVEWEQIKYLCYFSLYIIIALIVVCLAIKSLTK